MAVMRSPGRIPALLQFQKRATVAARILGAALEGRFEFVGEPAVGRADFHIRRHGLRQARRNAGIAGVHDHIAAAQVVDGQFDTAVRSGQPDRAPLLDFAQN